MSLSLLSYATGDKLVDDNSSTIVVIKTIALGIQMCAFIRVSSTEISYSIGEKL